MMKKLSEVGRRMTGTPHDRGKPCHYYTVHPCGAKPRGSAYSSDRACPCHASNALQAVGGFECIK